MTNYSSKSYFLFFTLFLLISTTNADDLSLIYGNEEMISIASGYLMPKSNSPSVTSVITSAEIEEIGVRRLEEVIEYLPGIHVSTARAGNKTIGFRGIYSETNNQVLVLINNIPLRNTVVGGKPLLWTMPVKNISQIEVIRGPGSMLYGGDATTGVINIITKQGHEMNNGQIGGFFGSQDTYEGWIQYGKKEGEWDYSFSLQGGSTDGSKGIIEQDSQTYLDQLFRTQVSSAPGQTNFGRNDIDLRTDITYKDFLQIRAGYQNFNNVETGEGAALALDEEGRAAQKIYNIDLSYNDDLLNELALKSNLYFIGQDIDWNYNVLPKGSIGGMLPNGAVSKSTYFQGTIGNSNTFNFKGIENHNLSIGIGASYHWIDDINSKLNYAITPHSIQQVPLTNVDKVLGVDPLKVSRNRTNFYALFQDEWHFLNDLYLTTGLRYDYYSDVEDGFSPRASLVWNINNDLTAKLLYSRSFRPPSFFEKNQPVSIGEKIESETMDTVEFQIENQWPRSITTSINVFWFKLKNLITSTENSSLTTPSSVIPIPVSFSNSNDINGIGVESEFNYKYSENLRFHINYSFHDIKRSPQTGFLPEHMIKSLINYKFYNDWNLNIQLNWIGERTRSNIDQRSNLNGYFLAGATLSTKIIQPVELVLRVNNIFGTNAKEPSLNSTLLPGDVPVMERSILGQIKWTF